MKEKRRDSKGRILHTGESQRTDGKYLYKYVDAFGNTKNDALPTLCQTERTEGKCEEKHTETTGTTHAVIERGQIRC